MKTILLLACLTCGRSFAAETNYVITTNWVEAAQNFRVLNGQIYHRNLSERWLAKKGEVVRVLGTNVLLVREVTLRNQYATTSDRLGGIGGSIGGGSSPEIVRTWREYGGMIVITNMDNADRLAPRALVSFVAMNVGEQMFENPSQRRFQRRRLFRSPDPSPMERIGTGPAQ